MASTNTSSPPIPEKWLRYIDGTSGAYATNMFSRADARNTGIVAYLKARKAYKAARGPFENYAKSAIKNALISARRAEQRHSGITPGSSEEEPDVRIDVPEVEEGEDDQLFQIELRGAIKAVEPWRAKLPAKLRLIARALYFEGVSQRDVGERLGLSQPRISQLHAQLLSIGQADLNRFALIW